MHKYKFFIILALTVAVTVTVAFSVAPAEADETGAVASCDGVSVWDHNGLGSVAVVYADGVTIDYSTRSQISIVLPAFHDGAPAVLVKNAHFEVAVSVPTDCPPQRTTTTSTTTETLPPTPAPITPTTTTPTTTTTTPTTVTTIVVSSPSSTTTSTAPASSPTIAPPPVELAQPATPVVREPQFTG